MAAVCFTWFDDMNFDFCTLSFSIKQFVCVILEDETLDATDQEIKLPKGRVVVALCLSVCELVCSTDESCVVSI